MMLHQNTSMNSWVRNMDKSKSKRNSRKKSLPGPICVPTSNDAINSDTKSHSSIISIKITNERDAENVVIEWYRNYRNNKPFENDYRERELTMAKRQSAGGGCRSFEIKRSYPCLKCKELNKICDCARFKNLYRKIYGPTTDETILVGMETLHSLVSSRCSETNTSVQGTMGTVYQQRDYPINTSTPYNGKRNNNDRRDTDRYGNGARKIPNDDDYDRGTREADKYGENPRKSDYYPGTSDDANIEIQDINKSQPQSRRKSGEEYRKEQRNSNSKGNGNGKNRNNDNGESKDNIENRRRQMARKAMNQELFEDDPAPETSSVYSELSKFVSSDGITNHLHSDESRLSLESIYTNENSVSSIASKMTVQNPSPLVSDNSNETLTENNNNPEINSPDLDTNEFSKPSCNMTDKKNSENNFSIVNNILLNSLLNKIDSGTKLNKISRRIESNEKIAQNLTEQNKTKSSFPNVTSNSIDKFNNGITDCPKVCAIQSQNKLEMDLKESRNSTDSEEKNSNTLEETDSTENNTTATQLYSCFIGPINCEKNIPIISRYTVPYWDREKPYPTVHFISPIPQINRACGGADTHHSRSGISKKTLDLIEYLLRPFPHMLNFDNNSENDSSRRSKSDSSLTISCASSVHSASYLFADTTAKLINQTGFSLTENNFENEFQEDRDKKAYIYDTGQTYLPTTEPELMFPEYNQIDFEIPEIGRELLCYPFHSKKSTAKRDITKNGSVPISAESKSIEVSDVEEVHNVLCSSESSDVSTYSNQAETNESNCECDTKDTLRNFNDVGNNVNTKVNDGKHESNNDVSLKSQKSVSTLGDVTKSLSNKSVENGNDDEDSAESSSSLQCNSSINITLSSPRSDTSNSRVDNKILREMNAIVNDRSEKQVLTPIQEESEITDSDSSSTQIECGTNSIQSKTKSNLSIVGHDKMKKNNISELKPKSVQTETKSRLSMKYSKQAIQTTSDTEKDENDKSEDINDSSQSSPETVSQSDELITIKQPANNFEIESSLYSPVATTCSCFTVSHKDKDDEGTRASKNTGKKTKDKQINTSPVRVVRVSQSQQTDPVKLRPIKKRVDKDNALTTTASTKTTTVSSDTMSVRSSKRKSRDSPRKSKKSSSKSISAKFERKSSREATSYSADVSSTGYESVTPRAEDSKEDMSDKQTIGDDRPKSDPKLKNRSLLPQETRYAIARITKYDEFTTYEILKSTRAKPRIIPQTTEGVFTVRNRKKRKLKF